MKNRRFDIVVMSVVIVGVFFIILGFSYAFVGLTVTGSKRQVITASTLDLILEEDANNIQLIDAFPTADEVGKIQSPFTFHLVNKTANPANYELRLVDVTTGQKLSENDVKYYLTKDDIGQLALLSNLDNNVLDFGTIEGNDTIDFSLRFWIKESITDQTQIAGKSLRFKLEIIITQEG